MLILIELRQVVYVLLLMVVDLFIRNACSRIDSDYCSLFVAVEMNRDLTRDVRYRTFNTLHTHCYRWTLAPRTNLSLSRRKSMEPDVELVRADGAGEELLVQWD